MTTRRVLARWFASLSMLLAIGAVVAPALAQCPQPEEVGQLSLSRAGTAAVLDWVVPAGATASEVVRGDLATGRVNVIGVGSTCVGRDLTGSSITDAANPTSGSGFWYLVRSTNECGGGSWGFENQTGASVPRVTECGCTPDFNISGSARFVDGWVTIMDRRTCLEWERKNTVSDMHSVNALFTLWDLIVVAPTWISQMNLEQFGGHRDWRIPSSTGPPNDPTGALPEIESILAVPCVGEPTPCIDPAFGAFPPSMLGACQAPYCDPDQPVYWSSSTDPGSPSRGWAVNFVVGGWQASSRRFDHWFVRAVRGSLYGE